MPLNLADREWNRIDDGVLPYALDAMRALWVWMLVHLWARSLTPGRGDWLALPTVFGLLAMSTLLAQYGAFRAKTGVRATWLIALGGLGAVAFSLYLATGLGRFTPWDAHWLSALSANPFVSAVVLIVAVWLWRWGMVTGREPLIYDSYSFNFTVGILVFVAAFGGAYALHVVPVIELLVPLFAFFAIGLGTLAIASLQSARRFEQGRTGQWFTLNRYWLGTVAAVIGGLLLGGLVLSQFFAPEMFSGVLSALAVVLNLVARALYWVLVVFSFVVFSILEFVAHFFPGMNASGEPPPLQPPPNLAEQFKDLQKEPVGVSPELFLLFQVIAGVLIAGAIVLIFALAFRRFQVLLEEDVDESRETVFSFDLLKEQLAQLFNRKSGVRQGDVPPFVAVHGNDPRAQIRRTYQQLLAWAASRGLARSPGQTPLEYLALMERGLHIYIEPISVITGAYLQARYSTAPVPEESARAALQAWQSIAREKGNGRGKH